MNFDALEFFFWFCGLGPKDNLFKYVVHMSERVTVRNDLILGVIRITILIF